MPHGEHHESAVAGMQVDSLAHFIELRNEVAVREHNALWLTRSARSKDNCGEVVPVAFVHFLVDFAGMLRIVFFAVLDNLLERVERDARSFCCFKVFVSRFFEDNQFVYEREFFFDAKNFLNLTCVFDDDALALRK